MGLFTSLGRQCPPVVGLVRANASGESATGVASTTPPKAALGTERKACRLFGRVMDGGMKNCRLLLSALLLCLGLVARVAVADIAVSTAIITGDMPATGYVMQPSISGDGRYVTFLYSLDGKSDVFVHDRATGTNRQVTLSPTGEPSNGTSVNPTISTDGRYIIFGSLATNLMDGTPGIFVYDQVTQALERISDGGILGNVPLLPIAISSDGRYAAFYGSTFFNGTYGDARIFVYDRIAKTTEVLAPSLIGPGVDTARLQISGDGRYVAYGVSRDRFSSNQDVFVYDRVTGTNENVIFDSFGQVSYGMQQNSPSMSSDGRFVLFTAGDIFVRDRSAGTTERVSSYSYGGTIPNLSADGRYVVYKSGMLLVHDRVTGIEQVISDYYQLTPYSPSISEHGRYVAYETRSSAYANLFQIAVADLGSPAAVTLSATALALAEGDAAGGYTMVLADAPTADVVVAVSPGTQLAASPTQLTFTPANWNVPQTVTVQALQDGIAEGSHTGTLTHTATSADPDYNGIAIGSINVAISETPVIPVATIPVTGGVAWTRSDLPVTGTAAPGATVTVSATNLTTGTVSAVSAVADANGAWSLTLTGLASGNYTLQPDAGGVKGGTLSFALALSGGSGSLPLILTGASLYDIDGAGNYIGNGWDTTGGNGAYNFYLLNAANAFLNSGNGASASLNQDISTPGTYTFLYRSDGGGFNWPTPSAGLNLFFNNNTNPGISVSVPFNVPTPALTAFGNGSLGIVNVDVVPGANALSFMAGDLKVTLTAFSLIDYQNPAVPPAIADLVSPGDTVPNGLNDYSGIITLQVARGSASSGGLSPVLLLPGSGVWTQANLPLHGTAPAGSTVTLHVKNLHTNATGTYTAVAAADGTWSILVPDLEDCHYQLQAEINGLFGNQEVIYLDSHAPTTALSIGLAGGGSGGGGGGGTGTGGWYSGAISLGLSAVDDRFGHGVGVDRIEYSLNAGAWTVFPGTGLTLERDGIYNFCYRALDNAGNVEPVHCVPLWIDMTAPVVTPRFDGTRNVLSLDAVDGVSGIGSLEVSFDGGASWSNSTGVVSFPQGGTYTVHYRCRDNAGNVTTGQTTVTVITPWVPPNPPYQSNGGFITGGGQVNLAAGSAQFDFVVKYQKGDAVPKGNAQLQLTSGKFDFRSSSFDWLVTTPSQAWFAGSGTLNGTGDYGYLMSVIDIGSGSKSVDALRLKVWNKANGAVVYDTQPGAADMAEPTLLLSKGNITIHK
jgi:Tol biopolymer transport system component